MEQKNSYQFIQKCIYIVKLKCFYSIDLHNLNVSFK